MLYLQTLSVTDDTVLEEHNEDPTLIQMHLIDDGGKIYNLSYNSIHVWLITTRTELLYVL